MDVNLFLAVAVKVAELIGEELACGIKVVIRSLEVREVVLDRAYFKLLFKKVDFVEKKDDR